MDSIEGAVTKFLAANPCMKLWVAYSGGLDSTVLLYALRQCLNDFPEVSLQAVHIHHGINIEADQWLLQCEEFCQQLGIDLKTHYLTEPVGNSNIEAKARALRYDFFAELLPEKGVLVTAHHRDDQAETLLLHLCRGAGVKGLAAMPEEKSFAKGMHARPLLTVPRTELEAYATKHKLSWVEDPSNKSLDFSRNLLRHQVMPLLQQRWPTLSKQLARTAELMQEQLVLLNEVGEADFEKVANGQLVEGLSIAKLQTLPESRLLNLLRYWIAEQGFLLPDQCKLQLIVSEIINSRLDSRACIVWEGAECRRWRDNLLLMPALSAFDNTVRLPWIDTASPLVLPFELGQLVIEQQFGKGGVKLTAEDQVEIRFRQGGERLALSGRAGHHTLKNLFQEWHVPYWLRDRVPLIFVNGQLAVVVGYAVSAEQAVSTDELGAVFQLINR